MLHSKQTSKSPAPSRHRAANALLHRSSELQIRCCTEAQNCKFAVSRFFTKDLYTESFIPDRPRNRRHQVDTKLQIRWSTEAQNCKFVVFRCFTKDPCTENAHPGQTSKSLAVGRHRVANSLLHRGSELQIPCFSLFHRGFMY